MNSIRDVDFSVILDVKVNDVCDLCDVLAKVHAKEDMKLVEELELVYGNDYRKYMVMDSFVEGIKLYYDNLHCMCGVMCSCAGRRNDYCYKEMNNCMK